MRTTIYYAVVLLQVFTMGQAQSPDYDTTGFFPTVSCRIENIPGTYETMDSSRIYYPSSGNQVDPGAVPCPIIVFGHGSLMSIDRYDSYAAHLASWGYVVVLPTFSNSFPTPQHYMCAQAMVDAARWTAGRDTVTGDIFCDKLDRFNWGFAGHSMGGGVAHLAADTFGLIDTLMVTVSMASPQTTPPTHSQHLIAPKLILAGSVDYLAPWNDVRAAYWDSAPAPGTFAVIDGANHGYFMDYSYVWEDGGSATISRAQQQRITRRHMTAYVQRYMKNDTTEWNYQYCFGDSIYNHPTMDTVEVRYEAFVSEHQTREGIAVTSLSVFPNPIREKCRISGRPCRAHVFNAAGQRIDEVVVPGYWYPDKDLSSGVYFIRPEHGTTHAVLLIRN